MKSLPVSADLVTCLLTGPTRQRANPIFHQKVSQTSQTLYRCQNVSVTTCSLTLPYFQPFQDMHSCCFKTRALFRPWLTPAFRKMANFTCVSPVPPSKTSRWVMLFFSAAACVIRGCSTSTKLAQMLKLSTYTSVLCHCISENWKVQLCLGLCFQCKQLKCWRLFGWFIHSLILRRCCTISPSFLCLPVKKATMSNIAIKLNQRNVLIHII